MVARFIVACTFMYLSGCVDAPTEIPRVTRSEAPAIGRLADSAAGDSADTDCRIILRSVGPVPNGRGGLETLDDGRGTWEGLVDVASTDAELAILYRKNGADTWYSAPATRLGEANVFTRYSFRLDAFTPSRDVANHLEFIPYLVTATGRLFDHNHIADPFATYRLDATNAWSLDWEDAPARCAAFSGTEARWSFTFPDFDDHLVGPVLAGSGLRIAYDGRRLRDTQACVVGEGPAAVTSLNVHAMFDDDPNRIVTARVEDYIIAPGRMCKDTRACVQATFYEPVIALPTDISELAVWFSCTPGFDGASGSKYDSNLGENYRVSVGRAPRIDWMGAWGLYRGRPGDVLPLSDPFVYTGYSNMGFAIQAEVYSADVDPRTLIVEIESDLLECTPGTPTRQRIMAESALAGTYGNNAIFRWGIESFLMRCPPGEYRYRLLASTDGRHFVGLGAAREATPGTPDATFRKIDNRR